MNYGSTIFDIGEEVFDEKLNLVNEEFSIKDGRLLKVFKGNEKVVVPLGVINIGNVDRIYSLDIMEEKEKIFENNDMEELILSDTVRVLGHDMLEGCSKLRKLVLTDEIREIGKFAFSVSKAIDVDIASDDLIGKMYSTKMPLEFVINYSDYNKLESLVNKMKDSGSFSFNKFNKPMFKITLVGSKLKYSQKLKLFKLFLFMGASNVNYVDSVIKRKNTEALIDCLNIINNKIMPVEERDINKILEHGELIKVKFKDINKNLANLNLTEEEEKKIRDNLIKLVKEEIKKIGNNEYNEYEMQDRIFNININLIDKSILQLFDKSLDNSIDYNCSLKKNSFMGRRRKK